MYDIPHHEEWECSSMTRRIDILKIIVVAAAIGILFYYLAHYGLSLPPGPSPS